MMNDIQHLLPERLEELRAEALVQFEWARGDRAPNPEGVALMTRGGLLVGGRSIGLKKVEMSAGANAVLFLRDQFTDAALPEDLQREREVGSIVVMTDYDPETQDWADPSQQTLDDLSKYPGIGDGQIVTVVAAYHPEMVRILKL